MTEFTWTTLALFLHVLAAIVLIGPMFLFALMPRLATDQSPFEGLRIAVLIQRYFAFAVVAQLFTGVALMLDSKYNDILGKQVWLHTSLLLFFIAAGIGTGFNHPRTRKALRAAESGDTTTMAALMRPVEKITGPIVSLLIVVIVLLMVWKPVAS